MFLDLNIPFPVPIPYDTQPAQGNKAKQRNKAGQQQQQQQPQPSTSSPAPTIPAHPLHRLRPPDRTALQQRVEMLIHCYTVIAFTQTVRTRLDAHTHVNVFDGGGGTVFPELDPRFNGGTRGVVQLRRLNVVLDEGSEKGFGFTAQNAPLLSGYDLLSLTPTTTSTFQAACLSHSLPSALTAHLISLDLTAAPRLPFYLKHTLVRTALKNGARFEICYSGALAARSGAADAARSWWAGAREVARAAAGGGRDGHQGVVLSSAAGSVGLFSAPADVMNLATTLGLAHETAHAALASVPKSLVIRAETRKTYRAILSEPLLVFSTAAAGAVTDADAGPDADAGARTGGQPKGNAQARGVLDILDEHDRVAHADAGARAGGGGGARRKRALLEEDHDGLARGDGLVGDGDRVGLGLGDEDEDEDEDGDGEGLVQPRRHKKRRRKR